MRTVDEYRALHGHEPASYACGAQPVELAQLGVRSMNFGQAWRTAGIVEVDYEVVLPRGYVLDVLEEGLRETKADAIEHPDLASGLDRALRDRGWPDAASALGDPHLEALLLDFYGHELLLYWLDGGEPRAEPGFVLNTIARSWVQGGTVAFRGRARRTGVPVKFQDV